MYHSQYLAKALSTAIAMQRLETELRESFTCYNRILTLLQNIDREVGTASEDELLVMGDSLKDLQASATLIDKTIMAQLQGKRVTNDTLSTLLESRENIVKEILLLNRNIAAKAMGVKTLLAHELATLRSGASAMKGYRQQEYDQGRIVNSST
jgi:hypothetical protein